MGDCVADFDFCGVFDAGDDVAHVARAEFVFLYHAHFEHADFVGFVFFAGVVEFYFVA